MPVIGLESMANGIVLNFCPGWKAPPGRHTSEGCWALEGQENDNGVPHGRNIGIFSVELLAKTDDQRPSLTL